MFEIPDDDDDLFQEEILLAFERDLTAPAKCQQVSSSSFLRKPEEGDCNRGKRAEAETSHSPQRKKTRILTEVNLLPEGAPELGRSSCIGQVIPASSKLIDQVVTPERESPVSGGDVRVAVENGSARVTEDFEGEPNSRRRSQRCFPGPAGLLPLAKACETTPGVKLKVSPTTSVTTTEDQKATPVIEIPSSQPGGDDVFGGAAWKSLVADLQPLAQDVLRKFSVRAMLHKARRRLLPKGKVPLLLGVVDSIDIHGSDAGVVVKDQTGHMEGTLHRDVLRDFAADLQAGAAVVLRQVSVISPSPRTHYLNITAANIAVIYPVQDPAQPVLPSSPHVPSAAGRTVHEAVKTHIQAAETELVEASVAARESMLNRNRGRGACHTPGGSGDSLLSPSTNLQQGGRGLFGTLPVRVPGGRVSRPYTPPQASLNGALTQTPPGSRFNFQGTSVASATSGMPVNSVSGNKNSIQPYNRQAMTPGVAGTRPTGLCSSSVRGPSTPSSAVIRSAASSFTGPTAQSSTGGQCVNGKSLTPGMPQNRTATSVGSVSTHVPGGIRLEQKTPSTDTPQSRWSFRGRTSSTSPSGNASTVPQDSASDDRLSLQPGISREACVNVGNSRTQVQGVRFGETAIKSQPTKPAGGQLSSVRLGADTTSVQTAGSAASDKLQTLWSDDLDDDILSQLSDDF
ncbi:hypothetical protein BaRGS_00012607 [Batillaria attramentaria]|uniref:Homologous recombination OB-fold protein OB-fold domain-containing protein n=1 Tax=Batillaria attramentaria TaxID=370345 RepID=A0ABD0LAM7_9CAEN